MPSISRSVLYAAIAALIAGAAAATAAPVSSVECNDADSRRKARSRKIRHERQLDRAVEREARSFGRVIHPPSGVDPGIRQAPPAIGLHSTLSSRRRAVPAASGRQPEIGSAAAARARRPGAVAQRRRSCVRMKSAPAPRRTARRPGSPAELAANHGRSTRRGRICATPTRGPAGRTRASSDRAGQNPKRCFRPAQEKSHSGIEDQALAAMPARSNCGCVRRRRRRSAPHLPHRDRVVGAAPLLRRVHDDQAARRRGEVGIDRRVGKAWMSFR